MQQPDQYLYSLYRENIFIYIEKKSQPISDKAETDFIINFNQELYDYSSLIGIIRIRSFIQNDNKPLH